MPDRIAFRMTLHPGQAAEYEKRHDEIFPELVTLSRSPASRLLDLARPREQHLFGILTRADDHRLDVLPDQEVMKRWWAFMCDIMDSHPDNSPSRCRSSRSSTSHEPRLHHPRGPRLHLDPPPGAAPTSSRGLAGTGSWTA
jgi:L-rhamnose mutarotase